MLLRAVFDITDGARIDEISVTDDPPVYEAPPGYDEVVKLSLESDGIRQKKRSFSRESQSRSSPSRCSWVRRRLFVFVLVSLDISRLTFHLLRLYSRHEQEPQSSMYLVVEGASTSRGSQTTPTTSSTRNPRVPESPPPPYVTPPGSIGRSLNISEIPSSSSRSGKFLSYVKNWQIWKNEADWTN